MQESIVTTFARVEIVRICAVSQHVGSCKTIQIEFLLFNTLSVGDRHL